MIQSSLADVKKIETEILKVIIDICDKHQINYFVYAGTLLGTIRHDGFIPWDDDVDLIMMRNDYKKFLKIAKKEIKYPYFLQTGFTDKDYYVGIGRIRRSDTTAILYKNIGTKAFNQGIFVDIFPLDSVLNSKILEKIRAKLIIFIRKLLYIKIYYKKNGNKTVFKNFLYYLFLPMLFIFPKKVLFFIMDHISQIGNFMKTKYVDIVFYRYSTKKPVLLKFNRDWFDEFIVKKFEGIDVRVPIGYKDLLTKQYGSNYMTPIKMPNDHGDVFFDTKTPYTEYLNGNKKIERS